MDANEFNVIMEIKVLDMEDILVENYLVVHIFIPTKNIIDGVAKVTLISGKKTQKNT